MVGQLEWGGSLHQTFRLLPAATPNLMAFLGSDGSTPDEVLHRLPYDAARSQGSATSPDKKRYRDPRHVYQTVGLVYEDADRLWVTDLGKATQRWLGKLTPVNSVVLGRHAAYALSACQLRNPSVAGRKYDESVSVFPFAFIWRAMIALDGRIASAELNRVLFRVVNEDDLATAIQKIYKWRQDGGPEDLLGPETITERAKNDRIIAWMALASFGWLLIADKRETGGGWYQVRPKALGLLREASQIKRVHREFPSTPEYVNHISNAACLPKDVR
jgi:hypothetical protein